VNKILLVFIIFLSCNTQTNKGIVTIPYDKTHVKKQTFDSSGHLVKEQIFVKEGNGLLEDGYVKYYNNKGGVTILGFFKKGKGDSIVYMYNDQGKLTSKLYMLNDSVYGSQYSYYENGKVNSYKFYLHPDKPRFALFFDSLGNVSQVIGEPLSKPLVINEKEVYLPTDTFQMNYLIASPEKMKTEVRVTLKNNNKYKNEWHKFTDFHPIHIANILYFEEPAYKCREGSIDYVTVLNIYDSTSNKLIVSDTDVYKVRVKK